MQPAINSKKEALVKYINTDPSVLIILPFEPKMSAKSVLQAKFKKAVETVEQELAKQYPAFITSLLIKKLKMLIGSLEYTTHKKSIALHLCGDNEKVMYLDIDVQEKIIVNESFKIRDIVVHKLRQPQCLLLALSKNKANLYLCSKDQCKLLVVNTNDAGSAAFLGKFYGQIEKEIGLVTFIQHIDNGLRIILEAYSLPLFLCGNKKNIVHFKQLSIMANRVVEWLSTEVEESNETALKILIQPYLQDWQKIKERDLLLQADRAMNDMKCVAGIKAVYKAATEKRGKMLIVENDFVFPAFIGEQGIVNADERAVLHNSCYIKDAVDDIIEKVLTNGGDVELVSKGLLENHGRILLI